MRKGLGWLILPLFTLVLGIAHAQPGKVTYVYTDPQGTPLAEADANGNITATFDYKPYGSQALGSPPTGPGYTGHVNDPDTGLVYMQARYYDPIVGRFLSLDPIPPSAGNIYNFSRFSYANNNPAVNIDSDGRQTLPPSVYTIDWTKPETREAFKQYATTVGGFAPGVGDAQNIYEAYNDPSPLSISIAVVGVIPEVGGLAAKALKEAEGVAKIGKSASKIDRAAFKSERASFWKSEAKNNPEKYTKEDLAKMQKGGAPTGPDGHPMELHHVDGTPEGGVTPMSRTDHRGGDNYKDNHPWLFDDKQ